MKVSEKQIQLAGFWKKFLRLTRGRITALHTLEIISEEESEPALKKVIYSIYKDMDNGDTLSEAIKKHPSDFSSSVVELIKAAEKTGAWDEILREITDGLNEGTFN